MNSTATCAEAVPPAPSASTGAPQRRERLVSLDVFRGLTVAGMLLVNDPGKFDAVYAPLSHAAWHGWTPADLVFPSFLFIVGITTHLSLSARQARGDAPQVMLRQIVRRAALIFLIGLGLHWFPFHTYGPMPGAAPAGLPARIGDSLLHLRIPGVLQRIALCYLAGGLLTLSAGWRTQIAVLGAILLGYWAMLMGVPVPGSGATGLAAIAEPSATLGAWIDRRLFDWGPWGVHLWKYSRTWDPEGALSTLPAVGTVILGLLAGRWIGQDRPLDQRVRLLLAAGAAGILLGLVWGVAFPINKNLWTSSYVLFAGGVGAALLALLMLTIELKGRRRWAAPFLVFGVNPILAYALSEATATVIYSWWTAPHQGRQVGVELWFTDLVFSPWLPPKLASLAFALTYVAAFYLLLRAFYTRGLILKI
ncbi:DUF5009 domain-containing protein [Phenylobacterium sp. LjRoot225]|uniref:acyltransferase family protein n=1 Tax=Phenylobacterium sp. LjRoot225 TaxID=3342285 RepID=UPI003ECF14B3